MPGNSRLRCSNCERPGNGRCAACHGSGQNFHLNSQDPKCRSCQGTGVCSSCEGSGCPRSTDLVEPGVWRSAIRSTEDLMEIVIRAPRPGIAIAFLPVWLAGWAFGEYHEGLNIIRGNASLFTDVWLVIWTIGGLSAAFSLIWALAGRERVTLDRSMVSIHREVGKIGRAKRFACDRIENIRFSPIFVANSTLTPPGTIAFEYRAKTYRFGSGISEAEAESLVRALKERMPVASSPTRSA